MRNIKFFENQTPGPWKPVRSTEGWNGPYFPICYEDDDDLNKELLAEHYAKPFVRIAAEDDKTVTTCHDLACMSVPDAHLMAAAPELYNALKNVIERDGFEDRYLAKLLLEKIEAYINRDERLSKGDLSDVL